MLPSCKASIPAAVLVKMPKEKVRIQPSGVAEDGGGFFWYVLHEIEWTSVAQVDYELSLAYSYRDYLTYSRLGLSRRHLNTSLFQSVKEDALKKRLFYKFQIANR